MVERGDGLGLILEPADLILARELGVPDHLQGDEPVEGELARLVDDAHSSLAEDGDGLVVADVVDLPAGGGAGRLGDARCGLGVARDGPVFLRGHVGHVRRIGQRGRSRRRRQGDRLGGRGFGRGARRMAIVSERAGGVDSGTGRDLGPARPDHLSEHDSKLGLQLGITPQPVGGGEGDPLAQLALDLVADLLQPALTFFTRDGIACHLSPRSSGRRCKGNMQRRIGGHRSGNIIAWMAPGRESE